MKKKIPVLPTVLLSAAALLLAGSTVGSTRAALTYFSENYSASVNISQIGVSIEENGETVSSRDYAGNDQWNETSTSLFSNLLDTENGEKLALGKKYDDSITVKNSGSIDTFVRVIVTKNWQDSEGNKDTSLDPDFIQLNFLTENGWQIDESASTPERTILYYTSLLAPGESTAELLGEDALSIDNAVGAKVTQTETKTEEGTVITTEYAYDGYSFQVEVEADAVQTHNAADAIKSAWGVDVNVSEDRNSISLRQEVQKDEKENFVPCHGRGSHGRDHDRRHRDHSLCRRFYQSGRLVRDF